MKKLLAALGIGTTIIVGLELYLRYRHEPGFRQNVDDLFETYSQGLRDHPGKNNVQRVYVNEK